MSTHRAPLVTCAAVFLAAAAATAASADAGMGTARGRSRVLAPAQAVRQVARPLVARPAIRVGAPIPADTVAHPRHPRRDPHRADARWKWHRGRLDALHAGAFRHVGDDARLLRPGRRGSPTTVRIETGRGPTRVLIRLDDGASAERPGRGPATRR